MQWSFIELIERAIFENGEEILRKKGAETWYLMVEISSGGSLPSDVDIGGCKIHISIFRNWLFSHFCAERDAADGDASDAQLLGRHSTLFSLWNIDIYSAVKAEIWVKTAIPLSLSLPPSPPPMHQKRLWEGFTFRDYLGFFRILGTICSSQSGFFGEPRDGKEKMRWNGLDWRWLRPDTGLDQSGHSEGRGRMPLANRTTTLAPWHKFIQSSWILIHFTSSIAVATIILNFQLDAGILEESVKESLKQVVN